MRSNRAQRSLSSGASGRFGRLLRGRVVFADWMRGLGNLLSVDQGEAYLSIYGNNESLLRQSAIRCLPAKRFATVGATGGGQESGLYFELRHLGRAFDPLRWLKRN
jgi:septal ring factor EnvC (AmiA/AmiB activator)